MRRAALFVLVAAFATPGFAQEAPPPDVSLANCEMVAGPGAPPIKALRVIGGEDAQGRMVFGAHERVVIGGGTAQGLSVGQRFFTRRSMDWDARKVVGPVHAVDTTGGLHITAVNDTTAIAIVDFMCDGILPTDFLVPYKEPAVVVPPSTPAEPDFTVAGHVVNGRSDHYSSGPGEFVIADFGSSRGVQTGTRLGIYRDMGTRGLPLQTIGEAVVVAAEADTSIVRLTKTRDAVYIDDLLVVLK